MRLGHNLFPAFAHAVRRRDLVRAESVGKSGTFVVHPWDALAAFAHPTTPVHLTENGDA
jgi:hypothetical protein